jgi:hypothetical protein
MRQKVTSELIRKFMRSLGSATRDKASVYLVGGASAVLLEWRESTIDVDLKIIPESDELLRSIPALKERLQLNIELASPDDFIPSLPGWRERSPFILRVGGLEFFHYDFYSQALAKIERGHESDQQDVAAMINSGLAEPSRLLEFYNSIEEQLYKYPALDKGSFRRAVERVVHQARSTD